MKRMNRCRTCSGFMIASASRCPNCDAKGPSRLRRRLFSIFGFIGLGTMSMTLMACYGSPCATDKNPNGCGDPHVEPDLSAPVPADMTHVHVPTDGGVADGGE